MPLARRCSNHTQPLYGSIHGGGRNPTSVVAPIKHLDNTRRERVREREGAGAAAAILALGQAAGARL